MMRLYDLSLLIVFKVKYPVGDIHKKVKLAVSA